jgi:N-acetylglucosaminyl-diphospho-decaprenol L-rhamnosyltransferase
VELNDANEIEPRAMAGAGGVTAKASAQAAPLFILHWNRPEECLRTVKAFQAQGPSLEIHIIDNHSEPEALRKLIDGLPPEVQVLRLDENKGWGGAFNIVLRGWLDSGGSEICFISAHDAVPAEGCIELLLGAMAENPRVGIACPEYGFPAAPRFSRLRYIRNAPVGPRSRGETDTIDAPFGTLIAFRKKCLQEIGLFDERYFAYGDEQEIGMRARKRNWLVNVVWGAVVENPGTWTTSRTRSYLFTRNSLLLIRTYAGRRWATLRLLLMLPNTLRMLVLPSTRDVAFSGSARMLGIRDYLRGRYGPPPQNSK